MAGILDEAGGLLLDEASGLIEDEASAGIGILAASTTSGVNTSATSP
jgi:hypothetical protein